MGYKISAELLQAIVNILQETPAKISFKVLSEIDSLVKSQPQEEKKNDKTI